MTNKNQLAVKQSCSLLVFFMIFGCSPMAKHFLLCEVLVWAKKNRVAIAL